MEAMTRDGELRTAAHLSELALKWWRECHDEFVPTVGDNVTIDRALMFHYTMSAVAYWWRLGRCGESPGRVQEAFERYAIARFIHRCGLSPKVRATEVRAWFLTRYRAIFPFFEERFDKTLAKWQTDDGQRLLHLWALQLVMEFSSRRFDLHDKERARRAVLAVENVWSKALLQILRLDVDAVAVSVDPMSNLAVDAPEGWLATAGPPGEFYDPALPEYHVWITVVDPLVDYDGSDPMVVARDLAHQPDRTAGSSVRLGPDRALAVYRTSADESGVPKDDRHWWLLERRDNCLQRAVFTLSVLAAEADPRATDEVAALWQARISAAQFRSQHLEGQAPQVLL